jgi:cellulose synthase/poly-beta-1,6-N-acetylglucosamine synthase-like glycosyltransferase
MYFKLSLFFLFLAVYPVVIYPILVLALARLRPRGWRASPWNERVAHIVTVHNEERRIRSKLDNALAIDRPEGGVETIVVDDGSSDGTERIVGEYAARGVRWIPHPRQGKEAAQLAAIRATSCRVIVFSDASTRIEKDALPALLAPFVDDEIGAVSGTDRAESEASGTGEDLYVRYEMALRRAESRAGSLVGLSGCFFAVRREIAEKLLPDVPSDLGSALLCLVDGRRAVSQDAAVCTYSSTSQPEREYQRKRRTALRGLRCLWAYRRAVSPLRPLASWQVLSHKVARFLSPFFLVLSAAALCVGAARREAPALAGLAVLAVLAAAAILSSLWPALRRWRGVRALGFFLLSNVAVLTAWIDLLAGRKLSAWVPTSRS